jgi:hypothetical protein
MATLRDLVGSWRLVSAVMEDVETKKQTLSWGEHPNGWLVVTEKARWIVVQTAENRGAANDDAARAAAYRSMLAYSGTCRIDGDKILVDADVSWDEAWVGTRQIRFFRIEDDRLYIEAAPRANANFGGRLTRAILEWQRQD